MATTRRGFLRSGGVALALGGGGTFAAGRLAGAARDPEPSALVAGSLLRVAARTPGASVEAHGSAAVRRLVVEGLRAPDAVALADPRLFAGVADRATRFATNALVLAYDPASPHAADLRRNWRAAIAADDVEVGRTDPSLDPLGYRTVMALSLAERSGDVDAAAVRRDSRVLQETDLLNVLEGGGIDAAFAYRSMAVERDLPWIALPDRIDFSAPAHAETYASVTYPLEHATVHGTPITYAAAATTRRGDDWVHRLVTAGERLAESGFGVPAGYPRFDVPVQDPAGE